MIHDTQSPQISQKQDVFTTEGFFEVAIESWPEEFEPTTTEFCSDGLIN